MYTSPNLENERIAAENYLLDAGNDFTAVYMTLANLQHIARQAPDIYTPRTFSALRKVLTETTHASQRQAFFLYKKAADALGMVIVQSNAPDHAAAARNVLRTVLERTNGNPFRAAAEALGALPLRICAPVPPAFLSSTVCAIDWEYLMQLAGIPGSRKPVFKGRNIIVAAEEAGQLLVVKTAHSPDAVSDLDAELGWMLELRREPAAFGDRGMRFAIPVPVCPDGQRVFKLVDPPQTDAFVGRGCFAAAFMAPTEYFYYPNTPSESGLPSKQQLVRMLGNGARLLSSLAAAGVVHTAPIPLFHNRVQRERRTDNGFYQWPRGGRLDRWLESCRFPNIGSTGIRDFEHFNTFDGPPRQLYEYIGTHIISLILIAGSYFRNQDPECIGFDDGGAPVDARHLFDAPLLKNLIKTVFTNYYEGFTGTRFSGSLPVDIERLTERLIDEMGVDRYMEEVLRVADQNEMNDAEFISFLAGRGFSKQEIALTEKGVADIPILTGPHLGGFNQGISVPELIEFTAAAAAMCVADRFIGEKFPDREKQAGDPLSTDYSS